MTEFAEEVPEQPVAVLTGHSEVYSVTVLSTLQVCPYAGVNPSVVMLGVLQAATPTPAAAAVFSMRRRSSVGEPAVGLELVRSACFTHGLSSPSGGVATHMESLRAWTTQPRIGDPLVVSFSLDHPFALRSVRTPARWPD